MENTRRRSEVGAPERILVATNLENMQPVLMADEWARRSGATLEICHVLNTPAPVFASFNGPGTSLATRSKVARDHALRRISDATGRDPGSFGLHILCGDIAERILEWAETLESDVVVVGPGRGHGWRQRNAILHALIGASKVPLLIARPHVRLGDVLAATDLAEADFPVLAAGLQIAARTHAHLTALNVAPIVPATYAGLAMSDFDPAVATRSRRLQDRLAGACAALGAPFGDVEVRVESGWPAEEIARAAGETFADLVVIGKRSHHSLGRFLGRSVPESVIGLSPCSVLVLPIPSKPGRRSTTPHLPAELEAR